MFTQDVDTQNNSNPTKRALEIQCAQFQSKEPKRHKYSIKELPSKNKNIALYSWFYDDNGIGRKFTYIECRYFYCHFYEMLAPKTEHFKKLLELRRQGFNLVISGYDGFTLRHEEITADKLYEFYKDSSRPFGHELVLLTLLFLDNSSEYPWNRYFTKYPRLYKGFKKIQPPLIPPSPVDE